VFQKAVKIVFLITSLNFHQLLIICNTTIAKKIELCKVTYFLFQLIYVNALPCETQMRQIVPLRSDYQIYPIAYFCIINSTQGRHLGEGAGVYGPPRIYDFIFFLCKLYF